MLDGFRQLGAWVYSGTSIKFSLSKGNPEKYIQLVPPTSVSP
jgi:hypothetical protein